VSQGARSEAFVLLNSVIAASDGDHDPLVLAQIADVVSSSSSPIVVSKDNRLLRQFIFVLLTESTTAMRLRFLFLVGITAKFLHQLRAGAPCFVDGLDQCEPAREWCEPGLMAQ